MKCPFVIKICKTCNELLVAYNGNFYKKKSGKWGLRSSCKKCENIKNEQWRETNKEYRREYDKQRYKERKEYRREYDKQRYKERKEYLKQYYKNNKDKILEKNKQYRENNPEK